MGIPGVGWPAFPHQITAATSPLLQAWLPYVNQVATQIQAGAGTVGALPTPDRGLVNLAQCFWVEGMAVPAGRDWLLVLPGQPDGTGRQIYYNFLIRVAPTGIEWDFGDGDRSTVAAPPVCGTHEGLVAHQYRKFGTYQVRATEQYRVTVDESWDDSTGVNGPFRVYDQAVNPPPRTPQLATYVGQLEGVPQQR